MAGSEVLEESSIDSQRRVSAASNLVSCTFCGGDSVRGKLEKQTYNYSPPSPPHHHHHTTLLTSPRARGRGLRFELQNSLLVNCEL